MRVKLLAQRLEGESCTGEKGEDLRRFLLSYLFFFAGRRSD